MFQIGIVAHIDRLSMADALADQVHADYISIDDGMLGCTGNHRKVWTHLATLSHAQYPNGDHGATNSHRSGGMGHDLRSTTLVSSISGNTALAHSSDPHRRRSAHRVGVDQQGDHRPPDWCIVLEDDAQPVNNFRHQLTQALAAAPSPVVGLYLGHYDHWWYPLSRRLREAGTRADKQDACYITTNELIHGVGIAIKTTHVPSMLDYQSDRPFDYHIRNWCRAHGHTISLCWPSIIDHADGPTLIDHSDGHLRGERKAWRVGTRERWTSKAVML